MRASSCSCIRCGICNGSGHVWVDIRGRVLPFRGDDLDDLEMCEECRASGVSEECDFCTDERELWEDEGDAP